jgi:CDP-diacylglycerol--glycerol-3-phosphate 3-phosphatidyltransferase
MGSYKDRLKARAHAAVDPVVRGLNAAGLRPDHLTWAGFALSVLAGLAFYDGQGRVAAAFLIVGGACDILDGQLARRFGGETRFGAFLDSTLDRLSEAVVLIGIAAFYASNLLGIYEKASAMVGQVSAGEIEGPIAVILLKQQPMDPRAWVVMTVTAVLALVGSFMVSYTRARAEGLGLDCRVGWFERPERIVLVIIAGLVQVPWFLSVALILLTVFSFTTAAQRVMHVRRITRGAAQGEGA